MSCLTEEPFSLTVVSLGARWSLSVAGSVDLDGGSQLAAAAAILANREVVSVDFDLLGVTFIDSSGWQCVQQARAILEEAGVRSRIRGAGPAVDRLLTAIDRASTTPPLGAPVPRHQAAS
ncbi:MAG: STAS domain-containing protein [Acidimicrobiales bacterium]